MTSFYSVLYLYDRFVFAYILLSRARHYYNFILILSIVFIKIIIRIKEFIFVCLIKYHIDKSVNINYCIASYYILQKSKWPMMPNFERYTLTQIVFSPTREWGVLGKICYFKFTGSKLGFKLFIKVFNFYILNLYFYQYSIQIELYITFNSSWYYFDVISSLVVIHKWYLNRFINSLFVTPKL